MKFLLISFPINMCLLYAIEFYIKLVMGKFEPIWGVPIVSFLLISLMAFIWQCIWIWGRLN